MSAGLGRAAVALAALLAFATGEAAAGPAAAPPAHARLFVSPFGEPFHATPSEPDPVAQWFAKADANHDGRIDRAEFRADATAFFQRLDRNHDGVLDGFEVQAYEEEVAPEILGAYRAGGRRRQGDGGDGGGLGGIEPYELIALPEPVSSADLSMDDRITLAEFLTVADRRFDKLDAKGLGYLTLAGLPKTPADVAAAKVKPGDRKRNDDGR